MGNRDGVSEMGTFPWQGEKTEKIQIRVTPEEKQEIKEACLRKGGITIGQHLLGLHRKEQGRI